MTPSAVASALRAASKEAPPPVPPPVIPPILATVPLVLLALTVLVVGTAGLKLNVILVVGSDTLVFSDPSAVTVTPITLCNVRVADGTVTAAWSCTVTAIVTSPPAVTVTGNVTVVLFEPGVVVTVPAPAGLPVPVMVTLTFFPEGTGVANVKVRLAVLVVALPSKDAVFKVILGEPPPPAALYTLQVSVAGLSLKTPALVTCTLAVPWEDIVRPVTVYVTAGAVPLETLRVAPPDFEAAPVMLISAIAKPATELVNVNVRTLVSVTSSSPSAASTPMKPGKPPVMNTTHVFIAGLTAKFALVTTTVAIPSAVTVRPVTVYVVGPEVPLGAPRTAPPAFVAAPEMTISPITKPVTGSLNVNVRTSVVVAP
jgi:hypothetical protein